MIFYVYEIKKVQYGSIIIKLVGTVKKTGIRKKQKKEEEE